MKIAPFWCNLGRLFYSLMSTSFMSCFRYALLLSVLWLSACSTGVPEGLKAVTPFDAQRYQGQWFEVARLDHSFERGLTDVTATYQVQPGGSVAVTNRGFDAAKGQWKQAEGKALFLGDPTVGSLKVSFFGPFYGGYHVIALDQQDYQWAMVAGPDRGYLWILARSPQLPPAVRDALVLQAQQAGFKTDALIWVSHQRTSP